MPTHHFDAADTSRFLTPFCFYVGASFDANECQLDRFFRERIWENGFIKYLQLHPEERSSVTDQYERHMEKISKGDILIVKRLNGKGSTTMRILAIGIVLGKNFDRTIRVAWVMQVLSLEVPLACIGTLSPVAISSLAPELEAIVQKARVKFLRLHLKIDDHYY